MESVGAYEAKTRLPALLKRVSKGERITITNRGVPVAVLVPARPESARKVEDVIAQLRECRKGVRLRGLSLRRMIEEGRR